MDVASTRRRERIFPFLRWVGELRRKEVVASDVLAGLTVATVEMPQSMANAQLASLPPFYGLYAAFVPPIAAALFSSTRVVATGSVALISMMTAAAVHPLAGYDDPAYISTTILLATMVGIVQIGFGAVRLGALVHVLSHPVVLGFTNAGALIIATSQIDLLLGVQVDRGGHHYERVWNSLSAAATGVHTATLWMGALSFFLIAGLRRVGPRFPGVLLAVVATTGLSWATGFEAALGGRVVGAVPAGLPSFRLPEVDLDAVLQLFPSAVAIALIGFVSSVSLAKAIAAQTRQKVDANQDLIGQGVSNLAGSFFQCYPVAGSFTRTAVNLRAGARTGLSSVVSGSVVAMALLFLTPLLHHLPLATLAAIIMVSVVGLIRVRPAVRAWRAQRHDGLVVAATFIATLAFAPRLDLGLALGIGMSMVFHLYRTMKPKVTTLSRHPDGSLQDALAGGLEQCERISVVRFDGSLYFGSTGAFEDTVVEKVTRLPKLRYLLVDAEGINHIDATGEKAVRDVVGRLRASGVEVLFYRAKFQVLDALRRAGSMAEIGEERFLPHADRALQEAWERLAGGPDPCERDCPTACPLNRARASILNYRV